MRARRVERLASDLTHEVTYSTLLQERRRALHARIAGTIECLYPERLTEHVQRLAHHAVRGEMWEKAVAYLHQAGAKAMARSANREAVNCFEPALMALGHLPETRERLEDALSASLDWRCHPASIVFIEFQNGFDLKFFVVVKNYVHTISQLR